VIRRQLDALILGAWWVRAERQNRREMQELWRTHGEMTSQLTYMLKHLDIEEKEAGWL
jgi:hypothetical protein